jgi:hypothetical protein
MKLFTHKILNNLYKKLKETQQMKTVQKTTAEC